MCPIKSCCKYIVRFIKDRGMDCATLHTWDYPKPDFAVFGFCFCFVLFCFVLFYCLFLLLLLLLLLFCFCFCCFFLVLFFLVLFLFVCFVLFFYVKMNHFETHLMPWWFHQESGWPWSLNMLFFSWIEGKMANVMLEILDGFSLVRWVAFLFKIQIRKACWHILKAGRPLPFSLFLHCSTPSLQESGYNVLVSNNKHFLAFAIITTILETKLWRKYEK